MSQTDVELLLPVITPFAVPGLIDTLYEIALRSLNCRAVLCWHVSRKLSSGILYCRYAFKRLARWA